MKIFAAAKTSLVFIENICRSSLSQMFIKIGALKYFAIFTGKHLCWSLFSIKLRAFRCFPVNIAKFLRAAFFIEHLRWLLLQMFYFTLYLQKDVAKYIVAIHCIIVSFWNLNSISFAFIRYATRCHSLCHSLSFVVSLVVMRCHSFYHSLSFIVTRCHSLYHSLSFVVTRCTTRLSFYKRSIWSVLLCIFKILSIEDLFGNIHIRDA